MRNSYLTTALCFNLGSVACLVLGIMQDWKAATLVVAAAVFSAVAHMAQYKAAGERKP